MRIAVFRARADGERTARRLAGRGHEALLAPVIEISPLAHAIPPLAFDGVIFTSAHGAEAVEIPSPDLLRTPCFCVGERTRAIASERGFVEARSARADADALSSLVGDTLPQGSTLLLVAGRDRKPTLEDRMGERGYRIVTVETYEAKALTGWAPDVVSAFRDGSVCAALHYSRRSATLALGLAARGHVSGPFQQVMHHCLSADAGAPLLAAGASVKIAAGLDEASLLATLS